MVVGPGLPRPIMWAGIKPAPQNSEKQGCLWDWHYLVMGWSGR